MHFKIILDLSLLVKLRFLCIESLLHPSVIIVFIFLLHQYVVLVLG